MKWVGCLTLARLPSFFASLAVALFTQDLRAVPAAVGLARAAGRITRGNVVFAVLTKVWSASAAICRACRRLPLGWPAGTALELGPPAAI